MFGIALSHYRKVEGKQNHKLEDLENVSCARHQQPILVEQRPLSWIVQRDRLQLVMIWNDVHEAGRGVDDPAFIDGIDAWGTD